jgi:hypothetical protein
MFIEVGFSRLYTYITKHGQLSHQCIRDALDPVRRLANGT